MHAVSRDFSVETSTMVLLEMLDCTTVIIFLLTFLLLYYVLSGPRNLPPGPRALPIVGNMLDFTSHRGKLPDVFAQYAQQYGNIFRLKLGTIIIVVINGPDLIHEALVKKSDVFSNRPNFLWILHQIGVGVVGSSGQPWKDLRRLTLHSLRDFGMGKATIEEKVIEEVKVIQDVLSKYEGKPLDMKKYLTMATSNIICSIIFGSRFDYDDVTFTKLLEAIDIVIRNPSFFLLENGIPMLRCLPKSARGSTKIMSKFKELEGIIESIIETHKSTFDNDNVRDFIDLYIKFKEEEKGVTYTDHQFRRLIVDLFGAGTETTSTTLQWALLYMMAYPDIQAKCQEEIDNALGREENVRQSHKHGLPYVEATLCEIQRLASVVPLAIPHATLQDTTLGGYNIPKNSMVIPNLMSVHMDPSLWPDPDKFQPERFLDENGKLVKKEGLTPFSQGPRICAGENLARMELFLYFSNLLQRYTFQKPEGTVLDFTGYVGITRSPMSFEVVAMER